MEPLIFKNNHFLRVFNDYFKHVGFIRLIYFSHYGVWNIRVKSNGQSQVYLSYAMTSEYLNLFELALIMYLCGNDSHARFISLIFFTCTSTKVVYFLKISTNGCF